MRIRHGALPALLTVTALTAPAAAQAATLTANVAKPCYGTNDLVALSATGFTPNGAVTVTQGQIALPTARDRRRRGSVRRRAAVQPITANEETAPYTATDQTNAAIVAATTPIRFSRVLVAEGRPEPTA